MNLTLDNDGQKLGYLRAAVERALAWLAYDREDNPKVRWAAEALEHALAALAEKHPQCRFQVLYPNGSKVAVTPGEEEAFFGVIEGLTGLDRAAAEAVLLAGKLISHPKAVFQKLAPTQAAAGADTKENPEAGASHE